MSMTENFHKKNSVDDRCCFFTHFFLIISTVQVVLEGYNNET